MHTVTKTKINSYRSLLINYRFFFGRKQAGGAANGHKLPCVQDSVYPIDQS